MSKWNTSYIPSQQVGAKSAADANVPAIAGGGLSQWMELGPLQAGAAVMISLLVIRPPFVMDKEENYQSLSLVRLCAWVLLSIALVWLLQKFLA